MPKAVKITGEWLNDPYVKEWFRGSTKTTKAGYRRDFPKWLDLVGMTPTEQIKKRIQDLRIQNLENASIPLENHRKIECS